MQTKEDKAAYMKEYRAKHKEELKEYDRVHHKLYREKYRDDIKLRDIKYRYGISADEYNELISRGCEACGSKERLCVDHCHETGNVRGCLCSNCNRALGLLKDNLSVLQQLTKYMEVHNEQAENTGSHVR